MGAKKKAKGNKLSKMSEEEKIRYLQHRAAIEEEARRRKEQLISTFLKNKLKREQVFSRLNLAKINQQWRQILRQIKCSELRQDIEHLSKWFEYTIVKKNEIIKTLLCDLNQAENQYSQLRWSQMETIDRLIMIYQRRLDYYHEQYKRERDYIHCKAIIDIDDIKKTCTNDEEQLQTALYCMEEAFNENTSLLTSQHFTKTEELRNNMLADLENLKNSSESHIEKIWQEFETVIKAYWEQNEDMRKQYLIMSASDYENCRQIFKNNQQINAVIDKIASLKEHSAKCQSKSDEIILGKKMEKEIGRKMFHETKKSVAKEVEIDREKLNLMNWAAVEATEELNAVLDKGKRILQLRSLCEKLETVSENVQGGGEFVLTKREGEEEENVGDQLKKYEEALEEKACGEVTNLEEFWKRYNHVLLEKNGLAFHLESLLNEQRNLKAAIKNYFSDYVVKQPESKVSFAGGFRFLQRRPSTTSKGNDRFFVASAESNRIPSVERASKTLR